MRAYFEVSEGPGEYDICRELSLAEAKERGLDTTKLYRTEEVTNQKDLAAIKQRQIEAYMAGGLSEAEAKAAADLVKF